MTPAGRRGRATDEPEAPGESDEPADARSEPGRIVFWLASLAVAAVLLSGVESALTGLELLGGGEPPGVAHLALGVTGVVLAYLLTQDRASRTLDDALTLATVAYFAVAFWYGVLTGSGTATRPALAGAVVGWLAASGALLRHRGWDRWPSSKT